MGSQGPGRRGGSSWWARPATEIAGQALQTRAEEKQAQEKEGSLGLSRPCRSKLEGEQPSDRAGRGCCPCAQAQHRMPALRARILQKTVANMGTGLVQNEYLQLHFLRDRQQKRYQGYKALREPREKG